MHKVEKILNRLFTKENTQMAKNAFDLISH